METIYQIRRKAFYLIALAAFGMILLASSVDHLEFKPGLPIPGADSAVVSSNPVDPSNPTPDGSQFRLVSQAVLTLLFTVSFIALLIQIVKKTNTKRILQFILGAAIPLVLIFLIRWTTPAETKPVLIDAQSAQPPPLLDYEIAPIGAPPANLYLIVGIILALTVIILLAWMVLTNYRRASHTDAITHEAETALEAIRSGQDLRNVIIHCYLQMMQSVRDEHGIERRESVTPREFERLLTARGIPGQPIMELTRLFEKARYSNKASEPQDELDAVECLSAIRTPSQVDGQVVR